MSAYIDIIIPRGGKGLVKKVLDLSSVPTIGHLEGLCHVYLDKSYNLKKQKKLYLIQSYVEQVFVVAETLLIHKSTKKMILNIF